jgi:hypothetical protein
MKNAGFLGMIILIFAGFILPGGPPLLRVSLRMNPRAGHGAIPAHLQMLAKRNGRILSRTSGDSAFQFALPVPPQRDSLDLFCAAPGMDTLFLFTGVPADSPLSLLFPCEPDTTAAGDILCPKCQREDQVYPMVYGEPIVIKRHFDTAGKVSYERLPEKEEPADTVVRAARFYCRRDKINF